MSACACASANGMDARAWLMCRPCRTLQTCLVSVSGPARLAFSGGAGRGDSRRTHGADGDKRRLGYGALAMVPDVVQHAIGQWIAVHGKSTTTVRMCVGVWVGVCGHKGARMRCGIMTVACSSLARKFCVETAQTDGKRLQRAQRILKVHVECVIGDAAELQDNVLRCERPGQEEGQQQKHGQ
jgi:hypothetical protein